MREIYQAVDRASLHTEKKSLSALKYKCLTLFQNVGLEEYNVLPSFDIATLNLRYQY